MKREFKNPLYENDKTLVEIKSPHFRPGTKTKKIEVVYDVRLPERTSAAMGDTICFMPAFEYIAENLNHIQGHLVVPDFFVPVAARIMEKHQHWKVYSEIPDRLLDGFPLKRQTEMPVNATGMHMIDLGFCYFVHINPVPEEYRRYPLLNMNGIKLKKELVGLRYAVMTPVVEADTRRMEAATFNGICDHLNKIGVTPVFLGKTGMTERNQSVDPGYDLTKGINLLNETDLLEAAVILDQSNFVLGIDTGLLHLAAMTPATILYGFTIAGPATRRVFRRFGHTAELYGDKEKLPCLFCQEHVRGFFNHHFTNCVYGEHVPQCVKMLNLQSWIATIDDVLNNKGSK